MYNNILKFENVYKSYGNIEIFKDFNLEIEVSEIVAIVGKSGSGKSTLLNMISLLEKPNFGKIFFQNKDIANIDNIDNLRLKNIGYIYQFHHLMTELNVIDNITLPLIMQKINKKARYMRAIELLESMNSRYLLNRKIENLSGGEKQRIAIARAIIHNPSLICADEPTGNLDEETGLNIFKILYNLVKQNNLSLFIVTHDYKLANMADRIIDII